MWYKNALLALLLVCIAISGNAQISFNINIGAQPSWGLVGYDYVNNYYFPDIETYYNLPSKQYTYLEDGVWITRYSLPPRNGGYNLYTGYKVIINEPRPYLQHNNYRARYAPFRNKHSLPIIRDSHDRKYLNNNQSARRMSNHNREKDNKHDNGNRGQHENNGRGNGKK